MSNKPFETITDSELTTATGGMKWEQFRQSTNVIDRRTPAGIRRDQQWWDRTQKQQQPQVAPTAPNVNPPTE